ncbi:MAG: tripartite tricarboxylate transporter substrate binding protein, partial [Alphaproteobacteria bacterium]|nr:tripartite tricarboxylate transporter substrate binding protein [Alphaproteobacteria bacterium]
LVGHHIAALQIEKEAKIKIQYIPNAGGGAGAMKDVIAGNVLAGINNLSDAYRAREAGSVIIIGVADLKRNTEFLPDVPTLLEQKIKVDDSSVNFRGIMVPKGTPKAVIDKLSATFPEIFKNARVAKQMSAGGSPVRIMTRDEVIAMWKEREDYLKILLKDLKK